MRAFFIAMLMAIGIGLVGTSPTVAGSVTGNELARAAELGALMDQAKHMRHHHMRHHHWRHHHWRHRHHWRHHHWRHHHRRHHSM